MSKPESVLDVLFIGKKLQSRIGDFSLSEIQFFAYLSCLLSLYDGHAVNEWNYSFIKSNLGSPYSSDIHKSLELLVSNNSIIETDQNFYQVTDKGIRNLDFFKTQTQINWRCKYLEAACRSLSVLPYGVIKEALIREPVVFSARNSLTSKSLLESSNPATEALYIQFASLKKALEGEYKSLIGPAIVWIQSLNSNSLLQYDN